MCPTTALFGDSEVGEQGTGPRQSSPCPDSRLLLDRLVSLQGLSLLSLVLDSVFSLWTEARVLLFFVGGRKGGDLIPEKD